MRKIVILPLFLVALEVFSQAGFKIILLDSKGVSDTVVFGMDISATTGIDNAFGELNLFGNSMNNLEIRSVQRVETNHLCLTNSSFENNGSPLYFPQNIDLKKDFRKLELGSPLNNNFEFIIKANDYPLYIITDFTQWQPSYGPWAVWIGALKSNCEVVSNHSPEYSRKDTIVIDNLPTINSIIVKFEHETGVSELKDNSRIRIYPNPGNGKSKIILEKASTENSTILVYTITGELVYSRKLNGQKELEIGNSNIGKGLYLLKFVDTDGYTETKKLIIK